MGDVWKTEVDKERKKERKKGGKDRKGGKRTKAIRLARIISEFLF